VLASESVFSIDPRKVVSETVDGETILIHLQTGSYYSLTGAGPGIWALAGGSRSAVEIARELAERHGENERTVMSSVIGLLTELVAEDLLEPGVSRIANGTDPPAATEPSTAWSAPKLARYDDMKDFLLVDPIHEVDESGWPTRKSD
jgi:Coenzyme PQQ synthesis protein D (PqqD)